MPERRIRTHEVLELLDLAIPPSAIRIADFAIAVVFFRVAVIMRRGAGWVAAVVRPGPSRSGGSRAWLTVDEHSFRTYDEALELFESLWPSSDEQAAAFLANSPRHDVDAWLERVGQHFTAHGDPPPTWRGHERSELAKMLLDVAENVSQLFEAEAEDVARLKGGQDE